MRADDFLEIAAVLAFVIFIPYLMFHLGRDNESTDFINGKFYHVLIQCSNGTQKWIRSTELKDYKNFTIIREVKI